MMSKEKHSRVKNYFQAGKRGLNYIKSSGSLLGFFSYSMQRSKKSLSHSVWAKQEHAKNTAGLQIKLVNYFCLYAKIYTHVIKLFLGMDYFLLSTAL